MPPKVALSPLALLPAEIQTNIATSLDYMSLCQLRSTCRHFYNMLTEPQVHAVFMNIDIPRGDTSKTGKEGGLCFACCNFCDANADQVKLGAQRDKEIREEIEEAEQLSRVAHRRHVAARDVATKARATAKRAEKSVGKVKAKKKRAATLAEKVAKEASTVYQEAQNRVVSVRRKLWEDDRPQSHAQTCRSCGRKHNTYPKPGVLDLAPSSAVFGARALGCSRMSHFDYRRTFAENVAALQRDGKICKICYQGGRRGVAGKARRNAFTEEFGYWMRENWREIGRALKIKNDTLALKSLEDIEQEEQKFKAEIKSEPTQV